MRHDVPEWVKMMSGVILTTIGTGVAVMIYLYSTFQTVEAANVQKSFDKEWREDVTKRLERLDNKLDDVKRVLKN